MRKADKDQYRVEETARWFAHGFWGMNASDYVSFEGIPENIGIHILKIADLDAGARSLHQYKSCPKFHETVEYDIENVML